MGSTVLTKLMPDQGTTTSVAKKLPPQRQGTQTFLFASHNLNSQGLVYQDSREVWKNFDLFPNHSGRESQAIELLYLVRWSSHPPEQHQVASYLQAPLPGIPMISGNQDHSFCPAAICTALQRGCRDPSNIFTKSRTCDLSSAQPLSIPGQRQTRVQPQ